MQKFVDLKSLGTKLQIISAFAIDHVKGFLYIEADKQIDIIEARHIFFHRISNEEFILFRLFCQQTNIVLIILILGM
jgi:hypothetical protein